MSPEAAQRAVALVLVSLGNVSYWSLARAIASITRSLSHALTLGDSQAGSNRVLPSTAAPAGARSGLSSAQVDSRNRDGVKLSTLSAVVRGSLRVHIAVSAVFFACILALPGSYLQAYWLYFQLSFWAAFCLLRMTVLKLPQPAH